MSTGQNLSIFKVIWTLHQFKRGANVKLGADKMTIYIWHPWEKNLIFEF